MGTRRAFVFTNSIFVVQTLLVLLLIWNVSPAPPLHPPPPRPPSISTWLQQQQQHQQQESVGRTLFAPTRPPPGDSRTSEAVFTPATQATTDKQNNFSPNVSLLPLSSSVIFLKRRRYLVDKKNKEKVKQIKTGASYQRRRLIVSLRHPSKSDSLTPSMTVKLKGSPETTVTPSFGTFTSQVTLPITEKTSSFISSSPSPPPHKLERLNAQSFRSVPTTSKTPTLASLFDAASSTSSVSEQNHKQHSSDTESLERKTDYKRLSAKRKLQGNVIAVNSFTINRVTYYVQLLLNHFAQDNRIEKRTQLHQRRLRVEKGKKRAKSSEMRPTQTLNGRKLPFPITDSVDSGDVMRNKTLLDRETNDQPLLLHRNNFSKSIDHIVKEKGKFLNGSLRFQKKIEMQESRDVEVKVPRVKVRNISETARFYSLLNRRFAPATKLLPYLHVRNPGNTKNDINEKENNSRALDINSNYTSTQRQKRETKRTGKTLTSLFSQHTNILKTNKSLVVKPVINPSKDNEPIITPTFSLSLPFSSATSLEKTTTARPGIDVYRANSQLEPEIRHSNSHTHILSTTAVHNEETVQAEEPGKTVYDAETEVNDIISGNSKTKNGFMLYKEHQNRQRVVRRQQASDTFMTARVYSSTLPARRTTNNRVTTVRPPLSAMNRSLNKTARNLSRLNNRHDDISNKHGQYIDGDERYLQNQFQNQSEQYQLNRDEDLNLLSRPPVKSQRRSTKRLQEDKKMSNVRKKRGFFLSDDIGLNEQKGVKRIAKKPLETGVLNGGSVDDVFAVRSRIEPREARSNDEELYETIYLSPSESKVAFSTLEFPETALRSPVLAENSETSKPLQILDIAVDTEESSNEAEYGSGDGLGHSFLIPCSKKERYFCLNGGTCLIVYTIDVKTCRCAVGFIGQRCEQIDHNYFYTLLRDTDYLN